MNVNYPSNGSPYLPGKKAKRLPAALALCLLSGLGMAQQSYTFTNCGATGLNGPTQAQVTAAYSGTNGVVQVAVQGIQQWTVPVTSLYRIEAWGATAGTARASIDGRGRKISGEMTLTAGTVLNIVVGQRGTVSNQCCGTNWKSGGGGASWVYSGNTPYMVAGGGGGAGENSTSSDAPFNMSFISGSAYHAANLIQTNNTVGSGGQAGGVQYQQYATGAGGAGWNADGAESTTNRQGLYNNRGKYRQNGFLGGTASNYAADGGFGGGAAGTDNTGAGGGGGGYTGGPGGDGYISSPLSTWGSGGGGSSYWMPGTSNVQDLGVNTDHGKIVITALCNITLVASTPNPTLPLICSGQTVTLTTNAVSNYNWSTGASTSSLVVSPTITTTYTLSATSPSNCVASSVITVTVDNTPTVTATPSSTGICAGKSLMLTGSGATTYTWTGGITNGVSFTPASTGNYTVSGSNACGTASAVASVTVNALPNIGGAANNPTVCGGSQVTLNGTGSAGGYTWTSGVSNNTAFTPPVGTNNYTVTGSSVDNCTNTAVVTVTVYQTPTISPVATPSAICAGKTSTLSASGAASGYTWNVTPVVNTNTMQVSPAATTIYTVTRANGLCVSTTTVQVVVNPLPNLFVGTPSPSVICAGTCASLTGVGAITYSWYPGGFQGSNITVCPNASTNYTVVASNANCTTSATSSVTVLNNPVITIAASSASSCAGSAVTMTANGALTCTWGAPIGAGQQNQSNVSDNPLISTLYNVSGTDAQGCTAQTSQVILVFGAPNLTTSIVNTGSFICVGGIGTLTALGMNPTTYNWLNTGGSAPSITVNPSSSTVYTVVGTNPQTGCMSTATLGLAVYISTFVVSSPTAICKGNTATLSVLGAANNYSWSAGAPNTNDSILVSPQATTVYYVSGFTGNCSTTQSVNLVVNPIPNVTAIASKLTICRFEPGELVANGATNYSWSNGPASQTQTVFPNITTSYTVTGTDINGCSKTVVVTQLVATCIGIEEQNNLASLLNIYPNPSAGDFTIEGGAGMNIRVVNELGQTVRSFELTGDDARLSVSGLAQGIYFIVAGKDGQTVTRKLIVEK